MRTPSPLLLPVLALLSCGEKEAPPVAAPAAVADPVAPGVLAAMDQAADPCQDFYQYACGGWLASTPLPADKPVWGRSFSTIDESNQKVLRELLDRAAADPSAGDGDWTRIGNFYGACMDQEGVDAAGLSPIEPLLNQIQAVKDPKGLMTVAGKLAAVGVPSVAGIYVESDFDDPTLTIAFVAQSGIGLPDRDYYLDESEEGQALLASYQELLAQVFTRLGKDKDPAARAAKVLALETEIARAHWAAEVVRDPAKTWHRIDRAGLVGLNPKLPWAGWLDAMGGAEVQAINVDTPEPVQATGALLLKALKTDPDTVRAWLSWRLISAESRHLSTDWYELTFDFYGRKVYGQQEPEERWKRCVDATENAMGQIVGKAYVAERFPGNSKEIALGLIGNIQDAFEAGLADLDWMDDTTRAAAIEKKQLLANKIGYPDSWRDYSALTTEPHSHLANVMAANRFENDRTLAQVGHPIDRSEWFMPPSMVNAYYHPLRNEMVFPAGILQPPFFDHTYPMAMNYGGIGMVMGHELTHGFDDTGRQFDGLGRMKPWWPEETVKRFEERTQCVIDQYDAYEVAPGLHVNGQLTIGENIADLGGTREAFRAWKAYEASHGEGVAAVPPLSTDQLMFVAFAQGWCTVASPQYEKMQVVSNTHSPSRFRVNGPLSNLPEFAETFSCPVGTPMHPEKTCEVW